MKLESSYNHKITSIWHLCSKVIFAKVTQGFQICPHRAQGTPCNDPVHKGNGAFLTRKRPRNKHLPNPVRMEQTSLPAGINFFLSNVDQRHIPKLESYYDNVTETLYMVF